MSQKKNQSVLQGSRVEVYNNDFAKAYRRFKKKIAEDGVLQEIRRREYHQTKGEKRRLAKQAAIRRYKKQRLKDQNNW